MPLGKAIKLVTLAAALGFGIVACGEGISGSPAAHGATGGNTATVSGTVDTSALAKPPVVKGTHFSYSPVGSGITVKAYDKDGAEVGSTRTNAAGDYSFSLPINGVYVIRVVSGNVVMKAVVNLGAAAKTANVNPHSTAIVLALARRLGVANLGEGGVGFSTQIAAVNIDQEIITITGNSHFNSLVANIWLSIAAGTNPFSNSTVAAQVISVVPDSGTGTGAGTGTGTGSGGNSGIAYVPPTGTGTGTGTGSSIGQSDTAQGHNASVNSVLGVIQTAPAAYEAPSTPGSTFTLSLSLADKISVVSSGVSSAPKVTGIRALFAPRSVTVDVYPNSDYYNDPQFIYVRERAAEILSKPNEILCKLAQTRYGDMINQGPYQAQVDVKQCQTKSAQADSGNAANNQGSSNAPTYETWTVNSIRADNTSPQVVEIWVHASDAGGNSIATGSTPGVIFGKFVITEGVSAQNPYGLFVANYRSFPLLATGAGDTNPNHEIMHGFLRSGVQGGRVVLEMVNERAAEQLDPLAKPVLNRAFKSVIKDNLSGTKAIQLKSGKIPGHNAKHVQSNSAKGFPPHIKPPRPNSAKGVNPKGIQSRNAVAPKTAYVAGTSWDKMVLEKDPTAGTGTGQVERGFTRQNGTKIFGEAFRFAYNSNYFKRENLNAIGAVVAIPATAATAETPARICMDLTSKKTYAWRYGLYDAAPSGQPNSGMRIDLNTGFPIRYSTGGNDYDGYASNWGVSLWLPAGVLLPNAARPVHKFNYATNSVDPANLYLYKAGGKMTKHAKVTKVLPDIKNVPLQYYGVDTDPSHIGNYNTWFWFETTWNGTKLVKTKYFDWTSWYWRDYTTSSDTYKDVTVSTWDTSFNFWSDALNGDGQINLHLCSQADVTHLAGDSVTYAYINNCSAVGNVRGTFDNVTQTVTPIFIASDKAVLNKQTTVMLGDATAPATLACFENCPDGGTMNTAGLDPTNYATYQHAAYADTDRWASSMDGIRFLGDINNSVPPATVATCAGRPAAAGCDSAPSPDPSAPYCWASPFTSFAADMSLTLNLSASLTANVITLPPTVVWGGSGYAVGDPIWVSSGNGDAVLVVTGVGAGGVVNAVAVINGGTGYLGDTAAYTQVTPGAGLTITTAVAGNAVTAATAIVSGGAGYRVGDLVRIPGGNGDAILQVSAIGVSPNNNVTAFTIYSGGTGYAGGATVVAETITTVPNTAWALGVDPAGSGLTVNTTGSFTGAAGVIDTAPVVVNGGTGYSVGELIWLSGGNGKAILQVASLVPASTAVATVTVYRGGTGYAVNVAASTTPPLPGVNCQGYSLYLDNTGWTPWIDVIAAGSPGGYYSYGFNSGTYTLTDTKSGQPATLSTDNVLDASWGFNSGILFDSALFASAGPYSFHDSAGASTTGTFQQAITCDFPFQNGGANPATDYGTCTWRLWEVLDPFYTWETGPNDWSRFQALANTAVPATSADLVFFDQPWSVSYTHSEAGSPLDGSNNLLQYNGYGDLWGIPGKCVSFDTGADANCDAHSMWAPVFTIPDGSPATATYMDNTYTTQTKSVIVKALEKQETLMPAASLSLCPNTTSYIMPSIENFVDPIDPLQYGIGANHAGAEPAADIKVVGGVIKVTLP